MSQIFNYMYKQNGIWFPVKRNLDFGWNNQIPLDILTTATQHWHLYISPFIRFAYSLWQWGFKFFLFDNIYEHCAACRLSLLFGGAQQKQSNWRDVLGIRNYANTFCTSRISSTLSGTVYARWRRHFLSVTYTYIHKRMYISYYLISHKTSTIVFITHKSWLYKNLIRYIVMNFGMKIQAEDFKNLCQTALWKSVDDGLPGN